MRGVERVANQHGVAARRVQLAVGLEGDVVGRQLGAAAQLDRRVEVRALRDYGANGGRVVRCVQDGLFSGIC
jgi:hypothetical protein